MDFTPLFETQRRLLSTLKFKHRRYLYDRIDWSGRAILIVGQRGVGKTSLMLQYLKANYAKSQKALYISVDNPFFKNISLYEFALEFEKLGGEILFIDEIHKLNDWAIHLKSIYDTTTLNLVVSGSSMIQISAQEADLSRRIRLYRLANLSFREYLLFAHGLDFEPVSLKDLFQRHVELAYEILEKVKPFAHFDDYLTIGCYPFVLDRKNDYTHLLINVINQIIEVDLPYVTHINFAQIDKIKKLIYLISTSVPLNPNISKLSQAVDVSRPTLSEYLHYLELGSLINSVNYQARGYGRISKPDKILIYNTNLMRAISHNADVGAMRETFFVNQLKSAFYNESRLIDETLLLSKEGDFKVLGEYIVEIGGKNKGFKQIKDVPNSFVVADGIEVGLNNKIPLWLFGFLY